ncbi:hypothetical protein A2U01_0105805, partial [Trifolium medium]|nr:hypothetical protein [Trifolium medium]
HYGNDWDFADAATDEDADAADEMAAAEMAASEMAADMVAGLTDL